MLTVYFVDDDALIIEELKAIIDWNAYGFQIIGDSTNPITALKEINDQKPDLIFSDIQMDEASGLEMVSQIAYEANVVFLSAYDRFEYVVNAVKLKALNYLRKPVKKSDLIEIVNDVRRKEIDRFNHRVFRITSQNALRDGADKKLERLFSEFGLLPQTDYRLVAVYGAAYSQDFIEHLQNNSAHFHILYKDQNLLIGIAYNLAIAQISKTFDLGGANATLSNPRRGYENIYNAIRRIRVSSKLNFFNKKNTIVFIDEFPNQTQQVIDTISACETLGEFQTAVHDLYEIFDQAALCNDVQKIYTMIVSGLYKFGLISNPSDLLALSALDFYDNYIQMLDDLCSYFYQKQDDGFAEGIISIIVDEMKKNVNAKMSLSTFAKKYSYNTAYLSAVFKKVMGVSFINYLTELKMNYAKSLIINNPQMSLKSIANEVGYYDYYHFSKMFKKSVGCSPTDFRSKKE